MILNNPLNIRYSRKNHWLGQVGQSRGFVQFDGFCHGIRAAIILLRNYYFKHNLRSVSDIIRRYAPSSENNTDAYIRFVSKRANLAPSALLSLEQVIYEVLPAMAIYESHTTLPHDIISHVVSINNIDIYEKS